MRRKIVLAIFVLLAATGMAQQKCYLVFFTDKNGTHFDPYEYFDAKAIERYNANGESLYDITNYPLNEGYVSAVGELSEEVIGHTRWLNAIGIAADESNLPLIRNLPFVKDVVAIESEAVAAQAGQTDYDTTAYSDFEISNQIARFGGEEFVRRGIDGKGIRIAVLDGGFPGVDKHIAFKHLRDNNQIVKTYNFPNKREDVYGWSSHGTMVLSCIAGRRDNTLLGLAQGAEFLLARTEIGAEPFKEEVWWLMAVEWADKNGANIINSSLGYGKERYYTKDMNGQSYVAKAANIAARKGILVCASAGNEGDDDRWKTIVTPSDADSVLCVGGITNTLDYYNHISFSSYGPTADGRLKPNVCAFGTAEVASPKNNKFTSADGTSFSSPLTAGFCACAWQTRPNMTAMQMKAEIEKSGDLYPYFDYALGYGVPRASYFVNDQNDIVVPTFRFEETADMVNIIIANDTLLNDKQIFVNFMNKDGILNRYMQSWANGNDTISIPKSCLEGANKINVSYAGYFNSLAVSQGQQQTDSSSSLPFYNDRKLSDNIVTHQHRKGEYYLATDFIIPSASVWGSRAEFGYRTLYGTKRYKIGYGIGVGNEALRHKASKDNKVKLQQRYAKGEIMQQVIIVPGFLVWDCGVFGTAAYSRQRISTITNHATTDGSGNTIEPESKKTKTIDYGFTNINPFQYGVSTSLGISFMSYFNLSLRCGYLLSDYCTDDITIPNTTKTIDNANVPRLSVGFELTINL